MDFFKHKHWTFIVTDKEPDETGKFSVAAEVTVKDWDTEEEALEAVKKVVTRKYYVLRSVWECTQCAYLAQQASSAAQVAKAMRDHDH